ncbi:MAG: squalene/phytoene synthase family protein [Alphaproteobacteria bacterium]
MGERRASPIEEIVGALHAPLAGNGRAAFDAFLALGRAARDIARDAAAPVERRQAALDGLATILNGGKPAVPLALPHSAAARDLVERFAEAGLDLGHARHVLQALRQDCAKPGYRDWADWLLFARFAAAPYGRLWIESAGGDKGGWAAAEALACALLLLSQTQTLAADQREAGKLYLPERWRRDHGETPGWRGVQDEAARAADQLLRAAAVLPRSLPARPARRAAAMAAALSRRWAARLATTDLAGPDVRLTALDRWRARLAAWRA